MTVPKMLIIPEHRVEGRDKVTGRAKYTADMRMEGLLHAVFVRSPFAHARIISVSITAALELPGVQAVITGADLQPLRLGRRLQDWPVLAWDRVRLVGDRVAAVVADTPANARAGALAVIVEYEELDRIHDMDAALAPDATILHPDSSEYLYLGPSRPAVPHPNVQGRRLHEHGDVAAAFGSAFRVFEHTFETAPVFPGHLEPRASIVAPEGDKFRIISTNKSPFQLRKQLAASLDLDSEDLIVDSGLIGGDFGGKGLSIDEFALVPIARQLGRPVATTERYEEDMAASSLRHGSRIRLRTATDIEGQFLAHEALLLFNGGAYAAAKPNAWLLPGDALATLAGYRVPAARVEAMSVYTNSGPAGNARAPGQPQNAFAAESHIDLIADALGMDRLDLRMLNALRPGDVDVHGEVCKQSAVVEVLEALGRSVDLTRKLPVDHGIGIAVGYRPSPVGDLDAQVEMAVALDGSVVVRTAVSDQGGGAHTALQRVVAAELSLPLEKVVVQRLATDDAPYDAGIGGGRITPVVGGAALAGARLMHDRLNQIAPDRPIDKQLQMAASEGVVLSADFSHGAGYSTACAYAIEVRVDRETGQVDVVNSTLVADAGTVINPTAARGQLVGGFVFGLGQTLMEEMVTEDGTLLTANLSDYKIPTMADVAPLNIVIVDSEPGDGPYGAKSVGELAGPAVGPAIANAVARASGARLFSLPITAEKVHRAKSRATAGSPNGQV